MNVKEIFIWASRDFALNSRPQRNADGMFEFCAGQLAILNKLIYQPLRNLFLSMRKKEQEKLKLESTIIALGNAVESEKERFQKEYCSSDEQLSKIDDSIERTSIKQQKFEDSLAIRNFNLFPEQPVTTLGISATNTKTSWRSLVFTFVFCELLTTGLLWLSMRDFLSLSEVVIRSTGILAIFLAIHFAGNLKKTYGNAYTYFQIFGNVMLLSAIFMSPVLSILFPIDVTNGSAWDLNSSHDTLNTIAATPVLVQFYRNFPSVEAVFVLMCFFSFQTFVRSKTPLEATKESPKILSPDDEIEEIRQKYLEQKKKFENDKLTLLKQKEVANRQHNTNLSILLDELKKTNQKIRELDNEFIATQIQYDTLFNELRSELHSYEVEYKSNISDSVDSQFSSISWPTEADILNHYKIKS